jgi:hypothetical protein
MSDKAGAPPKGKPWIWLTRDMLKSPQWQGLSINARRLIDFLMIEHMSHGGQENGFLLAPRDQLVAFGIGYRLITPAIREAKASGVIAVKHGIGRRASTFALAWLPVAGHEGERQGFTKVSDKPRSRSPSYPTTAHSKGSLSCTPYKKLLTTESPSTDVSTREGNAHGSVEPAASLLPDGTHGA